MAIVGSRLDYCNSLLAGTSASNLARLQLVQNTLARVVAPKSRYCHITPVLAGLHWLPVRHRINFKIATIAFKVLHHQQPLYLSVVSVIRCISVSISNSVIGDAFQFRFYYRFAMYFRFNFNFNYAYFSFNFVSQVFPFLY